MVIISASPSSPPSSLPRNWIHNVFPSFHGPDVRTAFLSHFLKECKSKGIDPFIDNEITRGEFIGPELKKAIQGSRIAIVLLSKRYASSSWCLDELVEIMKCKEDLGYTVMVIFYEVDPTNVKKQIGEFGKVFEETCQGKKEEVIRRWSQALAEVATIAGYHSSKWDKEAEMIEKIVTDVSKMLNNSTSRDFEYLVGMETHMEKMRPLLCLDLDEVRMIGIWGTPGIGKTTIAKFLFNQHSKDFQLSVFMANIKRTCTIPDFSDDNDAKLLLQQKFLSQILKEKDIEVPHLGVAQDRLKDKRVLVVLDDVDQLVQLEAMAKETGWFGRGSRIIITTQDQKLLKDHGIDHIYEVPFPPSNEALQMFCTYAFGQNSPKDGFKELALEVTSLVDSLPLGLQVMGSYFKKLSEQYWSMELRRFKDSLDKRIGSILKFSYDTLRREDGELFIHIACFFNNEYKNKVVGHLEKSFPGVSRGLDVLVEKSLISIDQERIGMHSLLAQLGKEIGKRQFLMDRKDICEVLTDPTADTRSVIGISSSREWDIEFNITKRAFEGMPNLQFLRLRENIQFKASSSLNFVSWRKRLKYISPKLQLLDWEYAPITCLRCIIHTEFLVELNMSFSKLKKLWEGIKPLQNLKWIDLSFSKNLKKLPNLSTATNLQQLDLYSCSSLVELPSSIRNATNLQELDLRECSSLVELPSSIGNATNLKELDLSGCSHLKLVPSIGNATNLQKLVFSGCSSLVELPSSIGNATNLQELDLYDCSSLVELPSSIDNAINLQKLDLRWCSSLMGLPSSIGNATNLQELFLCHCSSLVELPSSISNAVNLQKLDLGWCSSLMELPSSIGNATNLQKLNLKWCSSMVELPSSIGNLHRLTKLNLKGCSKLEVLPTNINLESLKELNLTCCMSLKRFPEISTNIEVLKLSGSDSMSYYENLKEYPHAFDNITELRLTDIQEIGPWVKGWSRLQKLDVSVCRKLVSIPQLPDSISKVNAYTCESLERLDCSFRNPNIHHLNFGDCFKLNQEARDLIIQTSTRSKYSVLPGEEVPACFTYRASGSSLTVKLNEKPLRTSIKFKACILLNGKPLDPYYEFVHVDCRIITSNQTSCRSYDLERLLSKHLYIFEVEAEEVTSTDLVFEFNFEPFWEITECGVLQILEHQGMKILDLSEDSDEEMWFDFEELETTRVGQETRLCDLRKSVILLCFVCCCVCLFFFFFLSFIESVTRSRYSKINEFRILQISSG